MNHPDNTPHDTAMRYSDMLCVVVALSVLSSISEQRLILCLHSCLMWLHRYRRDNTATTTTISNPSILLCAFFALAWLILSHNSSRSTTMIVSSASSTSTSGDGRAAQASLASYSLQRYLEEYRHEETFYLGASSTRQHGALFSQLDSILTQLEGDGVQRRD